MLAFVLLHVSLQHITNTSGDIDYCIRCKIATMSHVCETLILNPGTISHSQSHYTSPSSPYLIPPPTPPIPTSIHFIVSLSHFESIFRSYQSWIQINCPGHRDNTITCIILLSVATILRHVVGFARSAPIGGVATLLTLRKKRTEPAVIRRLRLARVKFSIFGNEFQLQLVKLYIVYILKAIKWAVAERVGCLKGVREAGGVGKDVVVVFSIWNSSGKVAAASWQENGGDKGFNRQGDRTVFADGCVIFVGMLIFAW